MQTLTDIQKAATAAGLGEVTARRIPLSTDKDGKARHHVQLLFAIPAPDPKDKKARAEVDPVQQALSCVDRKLVQDAHRVLQYPQGAVRVVLKIDDLPKAKKTPTPNS
jgi:hypothetical protein